MRARRTRTPNLLIRSQFRLSAVLSCLSAGRARAKAAESDAVPASPVEAPSGTCETKIIFARRPWRTLGVILVSDNRLTGPQ